MPPHFLVSFFRWYCHPKLHRHIEGDLLELYNQRVRRLGKRKADLKFALDVVLLCRPGIIRSIHRHGHPNTSSMYKSYLKVGWRNIVRQEGYSFINITGLAIGMAVAILNGLWIWHEFSYNKFFDNYDRIAQVTETGLDSERGGTWMSTSMTYPLSTSLTTDYAQHFRRICRTSWDVDNILSAGEVKVSGRGLYVDSSFPEMFTFRMMSGVRDALTEPKSILISASMAHALFGNADALNAVITINNDSEVRVGGVFEDFPLNTKWNALQFVAPWQLFMSGNKWIEERATDDWRNHFLKIYVEILEGDSFDAVAAATAGALKFAPEDRERASKEKRHLEIYPMSRWHLYPPEIRAGQYAPLFMLKLVGMIGVFVLLLACINFVNLSTARSEQRAKEVGIRKTIGSIRSQLVRQFFTESFLVVCFAFLLALLLVYLYLPYFNTIASKNIVMPWTNMWFWTAGLLFVLITGALAASWPSLYLSSFNPVRALKGTFRPGRAYATPRKVLVVFQFSISVILIVGTAIVHEQISFVKDRPVGYNREGLLMVRKKSADFYGKYETLRNELKNSGAVLEVSESMGPMTDVVSGNNGWDWKGRDPQSDISFATLAVSHLHGRTVGWQFVQGRDFDVNLPGDSSAIVINESALRLMRLKDPLGETLTWTWWRDQRVMSYTIIGVAKDMVMESPYEPAQPTLFYLKGFNGTPDWINIRINPRISMAEALPEVAAVFRKVIPSVPFEYKFADEEYAAKFGKEERIGKVSSLFAALAIVISCLGLFGLASFVAEQRTKEIGIRKVLGASVASIWRMMSKDFVRLVLISCVVASPLAWYLMSSWLHKFFYRTGMPWWVFLMTAAGAMALTLATVSYQSIRAALLNPVKSLKSE